MNPILKFVWVVGYIFYIALLLVILVPILLCTLMPYMIITLPYTLFYFSSNWSMQSKHFPPVELYLQHFQQLYPDLMAYVVAAHDAAAQQSVELPGIKAWPHKTKTSTLYLIIASITTTKWSFSQPAGFFARLEDAGCSRRLVWTFLRNQVEQAGLVTPEERAAFAKVMEMMNSHRLPLPRGHGTIWMRLRGRDDAKVQQEEQAAAARYAHLGRPMVHVREDSLDWLIHRGAVLLPNKETRSAMQSLARFPPVWGGFKKDRDLENGLGDYWQIADARQMYPWADK